MVIIHKHWAVGPFVFGISVADELWYDELVNGERSYHLFGIGFYRRADAPRIWLFKLMIPFVTLKVAVAV